MSDIEILEPQSNSVVLYKCKDSAGADMILVRCNCDITMNCPQGRLGSSPRCQVWVRRDSLSDIGIERTKAEYRFTR